MEREKNAANCIFYRPIGFGFILRLAKLICGLKIREREVRTRLPCRILRLCGLGLGYMATSRACLIPFAFGTATPMEFKFRRGLGTRECHDVLS
jgi:hypothetical protein